MDEFFSNTFIILLGIRPLHNFPFLCAQLFSFTRKWHKVKALFVKMQVLTLVVRSHRHAGKSLPCPPLNPPPPRLQLLGQQKAATSSRLYGRTRRGRSPPPDGVFWLHWATPLGERWLGKSGRSGTLPAPGCVRGVATGVLRELLPSA